MGTVDEMLSAIVKESFEAIKKLIMQNANPRHYLNYGLVWNVADPMVFQGYQLIPL